MKKAFRLGAVAAVLCCATRARAGDDKPKVAVFPLAGSATAEQREKVGFSLRAKFDRDGHFAPVDGPTMADLTAASDKPVTLRTSGADLQLLAKTESPAILIWGDLDSAGGGFVLKLNVADLRVKGAEPVSVTEQIKQPTDLRLAAEHVVSTVAGVDAFYHPSETEIVDDAESKKLWQTNPNLVIDGTFSGSGQWTALLRSEKYAVPLSETPPATDGVVILRAPEGGDAKAGGSSGHNVLAMKLSKDVAESNGLACLSAGIPIRAKTRYRLQFRYQSDGPSLHVFVKGYYVGRNIAGRSDDVECYRCQVPPGGQTHGQWKTVVCDVNPQSVSHPPTQLKVDLYAYLTPGSVRFDDVQLRAVGALTHVQADAAIKPPVK